MGNKKNKKKAKASAAPPVVGVDIGGTKIHVVLSDSSGAVKASARVKTRRDGEFAGIMKQVVRLVKKAAGKGGLGLSDLAAVGVGAPAPILPDGTAVSAPNLGWDNEPLGATLKELLGRPVFGINDCNAGTLAEHTFGAARGARSVVGLFMGTGLGGGLVLNNRLITGENHQAAELGHMVIRPGGRPCGCGNRGCLEAYASKSGMSRALLHATVCDGRQTVLTELCQGDLRRLRSGALRKAYKAADPLCQEVLHEAVEYLGYGVGSFVTMLGPEVVVLGGGVMEAMGEQLLPRVVEAASGVVFPAGALAHTRVCLAELEDDSVALGAVAWALRSLGLAGGEA